MRNRRITISWFPTCSTCLSRSQAPFCYCTHRTVANRAEGTFESLRYSFGGDHPSQTTRQALSPQPGVRTQTDKGRYFNVGSADAGAPASRPPGYPTHRLPEPNTKL